MTRAQRVYFLRELRTARAETLRDAESFPTVIHCVERLGQFLTSGNGHGLAAYRPALQALALESPLATFVPQQCAAYHASFSQLFERMRRSRNEAAHVGIYARHLSATAAHVSIILEDALARGLMTAGDLMIREVATTNLWEPVSFIRQKMIANSYSFLPVWMEHDGRAAWYLVSDCAVGRYLLSEDEQARRTRLAKPLETATAEGLNLEIAETCEAGTTISDLLSRASEKPVLVIDEREVRHLRGLITPFDLL